jgi:hypothetical protein
VLFDFDGLLMETGCLSGSIAEDDSPSAEVARAEFNEHPILEQGLDVALAHVSADVGKDGVPAVEG